MTTTPFEPSPPDMEAFLPTQDTDEGYSEHPLYPSSADSNAVLAANSPSPAELVAWLSPRLSSLTTAQKKHLAMAILNDLPTNVIAEIVMHHLNPRLYIDFVDFLPTEICLKIFTYLDPVALLHVAQACRGWYNLAVDWKLWEKLFYREGWKAVPTEILAAEQRMNAALVSTTAMQPQRLRSSEFGHTHKKRAISDPTPQEATQDAMDIDGEEKQDLEDSEMSGTSLFGGPRIDASTSSSKSTGSVIHHLGQLMMASPSPIPESLGRGSSRVPVDVKGKGRATAETGPSHAPSLSLPSLPKSALWTYDPKRERYNINWQYLYIMRRRLEYNWDKGRFTNFQLPHPDHLDEGHIECIYSLQFNSEYLVSGSRDKTLRIWNMHTRRLVGAPLRGHEASVLCLQFDSDPEEDLIVSGSSDSDVILWKFSTGELIQRLKKAHRESVLNVKFDKRILVTCSKDKTIKIFNRTPLRPGDLGYGDIGVVSPVPINLKPYGYGDSPLDHLQIKPPYTQIGCLEGHSAAVNAVQICGNEIVSASGDRHIKVWDWPSQVIRRTIMGHNKGIACIQYDGRRIVSGSSDNEVKVFDRETGSEVASLQSHVSLVRTVQAGFGDLPYSVEEDRRAAKAIDADFFKAVRDGTLGDSHLARGRPRNAGSRRPEDITAYGAKLPPGGGGGPYGRIVSGSYDQSIKIWRRDREGVWRNTHTLRQEDGATAAAAASRRRAPGFAEVAMPRSSSPLPVEDAGITPSLHHNARPVSIRNNQPPPSSASAPPILQQPPPPPQNSTFTHVQHPIHATVTPQTTTSYTNMIDHYVPQGPAVLHNALNSFPTMLTYHSQLQAAIDREIDPINRGHLRSVVSQALTRVQAAQGRIQDAAQQDIGGSSSSAALSPTRNSRVRRPAAASQNAGAAPAPISATGVAFPPNATAAASASASVAAPTVSTATLAGPSAVAGVSTQPADAVPATRQQPFNQTQAQTAATGLQAAAVSNHATGGPPAAATTAATMPIPGQHHPHIASADAARVFKLQFDARRIICCSQTSIIVGWDFCNDDPELEEVARFFATIE